MNAGSVIMNHVVKVNKKLSKVNMTQVSKIMMLTNITLNKKKKKKCLIHYQNWPLSTEDEITIVITT